MRLDMNKAKAKINARLEGVRNVAGSRSMLRSKSTSVLNSGLMQRRGNLPNAKHASSHQPACTSNAKRPRLQGPTSIISTGVTSSTTANNVLASKVDTLHECSDDTSTKTVSSSTTAIPNAADSICSAGEMSNVTPTSNILVAVRVRPENETEKFDKFRRIIDIIDDETLIFDPPESSDDFFFRGKKQSRRDLNKKVCKNHTFAFDSVFGPTSTTEQVFLKTTKHLIDAVFNGYNCSVFVYGATGAGKTHTMVGCGSDPGLSCRTVTSLYDRIEASKADFDCELAMSYAEVYNETVFDLMNPGKTLSVREDSNSTISIPGLTVHRPSGSADFLRLLKIGNKNRTQHPTDANAQSSRSHAIFQMFLKVKSIGGGMKVQCGKLSMIDLAGSEKACVAHARGGARLREGANINKSLLALGNCINALAEGSKYIPYRNSKLTRMLKDSIGGNCKTVMISNVSPSSMTFEDSYNTLKYADRAKRIKVDLKKNMALTGSSSAVTAHYTKVIDKLRNEMEVWKRKCLEAETSNKSLQSKICELQEQLEQRSTETITNDEKGGPTMALQNSCNTTFNMERCTSSPALTEQTFVLETTRVIESEIETEDTNNSQPPTTQPKKSLRTEFSTDIEMCSNHVDKHAKLSSKLSTLVLYNFYVMQVGERIGLVNGMRNVAAIGCDEITRDENREPDSLTENSKVEGQSVPTSSFETTGGQSDQIKTDRKLAFIQKKISFLSRKFEKSRNSLTFLKQDMFNKMEERVRQSNSFYSDEELQLLKCEFENYEYKLATSNLLDLFATTYQQDVIYCSTLIERCLRLLRSNHLIMDSYQHIYQIEKNKYQELVDFISCKHVRFSEHVSGVADGFTNNINNGTDKESDSNSDDSERMGSIFSKITALVSDMISNPSALDLVEYDEINENEDDLNVADESKNIGRQKDETIVVLKDLTTSMNNKTSCPDREALASDNMTIKKVGEHHSVLHSSPPPPPLLMKNDE